MILRQRPPPLRPIILTMRPQNTQTQQEGAETFSSLRRVTWNDNSSSLRSSLDPPKLSDIRSKRGSLDPLDPPYVETSPVSQQRCKSRNVYAQMSPRNPMLATNTHYNMYEANVNSRWMQAFGVTHTHTQYSYRPSNVDEAPGSDDL